MGRFDDLALAWDSEPKRVEGAMIFVDKVKATLQQDIKHFKLLDYGCGSGLVSFGFAGDVENIDGLDNSSGMIDVYNKKAKDIGLKNISGKLHNINNEDLKSNTYNLIVTNMTMHHINSPFDFVSKLTKSLKNGGHIFIADLYLEDGTFHGDNDGVVHFGFDIDTVKEAFFKAGLENIKIEKLHSISKVPKNYDVFIASGTKL